MDSRHIVPPVTVLAAASTAVFYTLYAFAYIGGLITSFIFLTAVLLFCVLSVFLIAVSVAGKLLHRNLKYRERHDRNHRTAIPMHCVRFAVRFALCAAAGIAIGSYSALALQREQRPPQTLAALYMVRTLIAELTGEPVPAGTDYYRIPVKLIACSTGRNEQFSASGVIQLFVPAALVRGTYSGGINRIGEAEQSEKTIPLLRGTAAFCY